jgi:hypothetical protein
LIIKLNKKKLIKKEKKQTKRHQPFHCGLSMQSTVKDIKIAKKQKEKQTKSISQ